jgi:hypothetical protein
MNVHDSDVVGIDVDALVGNDQLLEFYAVRIRVS